MMQQQIPLMSFQMDKLCKYWLLLDNNILQDMRYNLIDQLTHTYQQHKKQLIHLCKHFQKDTKNNLQLNEQIHKRFDQKNTLLNLKLLTNNKILLHKRDMRFVQSKVGMFLQHMQFEHPLYSNFLLDMKCNYSQK